MDEWQLKQVMQQYGDQLLRLAYLYTKDWALSEEIVQDTFLAYALQTYREEASLKTYLTKITINKSKNALRFKWAKKRRVTYEDEQYTQSIEEHLLKEEHQRNVVGSILQLPMKYREPLILYYYDECTIEEIAKLLQLPINTVKTRLRRAKQQLERVIEWEVAANE